MQSPRSQPARWPPTELALAAQYAVSRTVVRETVGRLRSGGLLVARPGSGAFVAALDAARACVDRVRNRLSEAAPTSQPMALSTLSTEIDAIR